jgi:hypothetical protein
MRDEIEEKKLTYKRLEKNKINKKSKKWGPNLK